MEKTKSVDAYYDGEHHFKEGINQLRKIALQTEAVETLKWGIPVYTLNNKNVFGIARFKHHFGIWFYNGAYMNDPKNVLENAQEGKTKAMRGWKLYKIEEIHTGDVLAYLQEAIIKHKEGKVLKVEKSKKELTVPDLLQQELNNDDELKQAFTAFAFYKQKEFCEHINEAKQEKTKLRRLEKILPMIKKGVGLNDGYR